MSLINQMLKDLAKRSKALGSSNITLVGLNSTHLPCFKARTKSHTFINVLLVLVILLCIPLLLHKPIPQPTTQIPPLVNQPSLVNPTETSFSEITKNPTELTGISLQAQQNTTSVRLLLNQTTLYTLSSSANGQKLIIRLDNTHLIASLPQFNYTNSAIRDITTSNEDDGSLKFIFTLNSGATVKHIDITQTDKAPELQLDIDYQTPIEEKITLNEAAHHALNIKKQVLEVPVQQQYQEALNLSAVGLLDKAIFQLKNISEKFPDFLPASESLIVLLLEQGNKAEAQKTLDISLKQRPNSPVFIQLKARMLLSDNKIDEALSLLQSAAPPIQSNPDYHAFIAALYQRKGQFILAAKLYEQLLPLQPENATWWLGLGIAEDSLGNHNEALEAYSRAENSGNLSPELRAYIEAHTHNTTIIPG